MAETGATGTWRTIGGQEALQRGLDGIKRISVLSSEEFAALESVMPMVDEQG